MNARGGFRALILLMASALLASGCGGGGGTASTGSDGTNSGSTSSGPPDNVLAVTVEAGPFNVINTPYASVTVCAPGGVDCQTVDHVLIDTGSTGVRLFASVLSPTLLQDFANQSAGKPATGECGQFADGYTWGPVRQADLRMGAKSLSGIALHVIGDTSFAAAPSDCVATGPSDNTPDAFGANGVVGVDMFRQDCGAACAQSATNGVYYNCSGNLCQPVAMPLAQQLQNPVSLLAADNNGVVLSLPAISSGGAISVSGSLFFGIGTQSNNAIGTSATVLRVDPGTGYITTIYKSRTLANSFIDSGSNGVFFSDSSLPTCNQGFYCPSSTQTLNATNRGNDGTTSSITFNVANTNSLVVGSLSAFDDLGGSNSTAGSFDWGLPFFFGRSVYTAIEGRSTPRGTGPYFAY